MSENGPYEELRPGYLAAESSIAEAALQDLRCCVTESGSYFPNAVQCRERLMEVQESTKWSSRLVTEMTASAALYTDIHSILIKNDRMPQYLIDILAVAMAVIDGPDELGDEALRREKRATEAWDKHEIKRKSNQKFVITYGVDNEIGRRIALEFSYQEEADSWSLQYAFAEEREYEVCGNHLYRVINGQLFGDPVGSEEDLKNIAEKHYLPSRLDLDVLLQPN